MSSNIVERITPADSVVEFIEKTPESIKRMARQEAILHDRLWSTLPESHVTVQKLQELVNFLLQKANLPPNFLRIKVFDSEMPELHVQVYEKTIRLSRDFLQTLDGKAPLIAAALGHEIGHVLLAHFQGRAAEAKDPADTVSFDPLNERVQRYEHEYQADRASVIITNRLGLPPTLLADVLNDLDRRLTSKRKEAGLEEDEDVVAEKQKDYYAWIVNTHPNITRRTFSIIRDSGTFPKYPRSFNFKDIPIPATSDFPEIRSEAWNEETDFLSSNLYYPDCIWEEISPPVFEEESTRTVENGEESAEESLAEKQPVAQSNKRIKALGKPEDFVGTGFAPQNTDPLSSVPEEVNKWAKKDLENIESWWGEAMAQFDSTDSYQDLVDDISKYSLKAVRLLLSSVCPEYDNTQVPLTGDKDYDKEGRITVAIGEVEDAHTKNEMMLVTSLLVRAWFKKDKTLQTVGGMRKMGEFLKDFFNQHGEYLPYTGARFFVQLESLFSQAKDDEERKDILQLCEEYETELVSAHRAGSRLAEALMPKLSAWAEEHWQKKLFQLHKVERKKKFRLNQLPEDIYNVAHNKEAAPEQALQALKIISPNYRPPNLSLEVISVIGSENKRIDKEGYPDSYLDSDPRNAANYLSTDEFEERYFGNRRNDYEKANYAFMDRNIEEYKIISQLWKVAKCNDNFNALPSGSSKLSYLLDTYRACSAERDQLIAEALDWPKLTHVEDVVDLQKVILEIEDSDTLFILLDTFSNPLLNLAVSQRLWELYQREPQTFIDKAPASEKAKVKSEIEEVEGILSSDKLQAILLCYRSPSYVRDELLRPLVDNAHNQANTLALASWYSEPPPGLLRPRERGIVAVSETLMDIMRGVSISDKQELFLYFLGQRFFISGIDAKFFPEKADEIERFRKEALEMGERKFKQIYSLEDTEEGVYGESEDNKIEREYLVDSPDSLVILTKSSGIPIDILLREQRLATTKREQRDFITHLLFGGEGLLASENKEAFLQSIARNVVVNSSWGERQEVKGQAAMIDLLTFALSNCPERRLPDLFLGLWNLQQDKHSLPQVVAALLREMGSLFIKAGQYLGTQSNTLPLEWTQAFRGLSDQNARAEKTLVYEHEHAVYGDSSPLTRIGAKLGEGSMAAVYEGSLKNTQQTVEEHVAIKISHPNIEDELNEDTKYLSSLVDFINKNKDKFKVRLPTNLAEVSKKQIIDELSFENVQKNYQEMDRVLKNSGLSMLWGLPTIHTDVSRSKFIIYHFSEGKPLDQLSEKHRSSAQGEIALELLRQILVEGIYQGDPNIGNFKVVTTADGTPIKVDWLDLDHIGRLKQSETKQLRILIKELLATREPNVIAGSLTDCVQTDVVDSELLKQDVEKWLIDQSILAEASLENLENTFVAFLDFLGERKLLLKENYVTLLRALGLMKPFLKDVPFEKLAPFFATLE